MVTVGPYSIKQTFLAVTQEAPPQQLVGAIQGESLVN